VLTACLAAFTASSIRNLGQDLLVANSLHLRPHCRQTSTDAEFHASLRPCIPVRANVLLAFPQTRLRLSACLRRSPSISRVESSARLQLHLQHDSLVEDQSTPCPVDFKVSCVAVLNQPRATACRSTHPLGMHHVFPRHKIRTTSALTLVRHCRRS
jgi:hypothetical protein